MYAFIRKMIAGNATTKRRKRRLQLERMEERRVLASLALVGTEIRYTGSNTAADNITVEYDAGTGQYTFSDPIQPITSASITDLDTTNPNIFKFNAASVAFNLFRFNNQGVGTDTPSQSITLKGLRANEQIVFTNPVGVTDSVFFENTIQASGTVIVQADQIGLAGTLQSTGEVRLAGPASLTANSVLKSTAGSVRATSTINGGFSLDIQPATFANLEGSIGASTPLSELSVQASGNISFGSSTAQTTVTTTGNLSAVSGATLAVSGNLTSGGNVALGGSTASFVGTGPFTVKSGGSASNTLGVTGGISATAASGSALTLDGGNGEVTVAGAMSNVTTFAATGHKKISLQSPLVVGAVNLASTTGVSSAGLRATTGALLVTGPLAFDQAVGAISTSAATTWTVTGALTGNGNNLDIRTADSVTVGGAVSNMGLLDIQKSAGVANTSIDIGSISVNNILLRSAAVKFRGDVSALTDDVTVFGNITLQPATPQLVTIQSGLGTGDDVLLTGNVAGATGNESLQLKGGSGSTRVISGGVSAIDSFFASASRVDLGAVTAANDIELAGVTFNLGAASSLKGSGEFRLVPLTNGGNVGLYNRTTAPVTGSTAFSKNNLTAVSPGFTKFQLGNSTAGTVTIFGDFDQATSMNLTGPAAPIVMVGQDVKVLERLQLGATGSLQMNAGSTAAFSENGLILDGSVSIKKLASGVGTLTINGNRIVYSPSSPWGLFDLTIDGNGGNVVVNPEINGQNNASVKNLLVTNSTTSITFNSLTSVAANNNVNILSDVSLARGAFARTGSISIDGDVTLTGASSFFAGNGGTIDVTGDILANGNGITVRGAKAADAVSAVTLHGNVVNAGAVTMTPVAGGTPISQLNVKGIAASSSLALTAGTINLNGALSAANGNLLLTGAVQLVGDSSLTNTSALATRLTRVDGTINGAYGLTIGSATGTVSISGAVGGTAALNSLDITSNGQNAVSAAINVNNSFSWIVGNNTITTERLQVLAPITVTGTGGTLLLKAYRVTASAALTAETVTVITVV